jgi:hypothetical protein
VRSGEKTLGQAGVLSHPRTSIEDDPGMAAPSLKVLQAIWAEDDGALFDIFVTDTTPNDWQVVVDAVREMNWPTAYTVDGVAAEMPPEVEDIFAARRADATLLWSIEPGAGVTINCHFFYPGEIEFDFCSREIVSDQALAALLGFIAHVGRALGRLAGVTVEGDHDPRPATGHLYYDPQSDAVVANAGPGDER